LLCGEAPISSAARVFDDGVTSPAAGGTRGLAQPNGVAVDDELDLGPGEES
jgi:hypothetical protein